MRRTLMTLAVVLASSLPALAQGTPPANPDAKTPAVNSPNTTANPGAPVAGANSFTEGQAKSQIESKGFTAVTALKKDEAGVWRGQAQQSGKSVAVSVDFQGNVVAK
ncbi:MAG: PepSY domain-containing protein [Pseudolabrys sp.]|nr:PepSY domain-containing protein [Pseudolabrys sp.]